ASAAFGTAFGCVLCGVSPYQKPIKRGRYALGKETVKFFSFISQARKNEMWGFLLLALSIFTFISLFSFDPKDISFYTFPPNRPPHNYAGWLGAHLAFGLYFSFGWAAYLIPALTLVWSLSKFGGRTPQMLHAKLIGILLVLVASSTLLTLKNLVQAEAKFRAGGVVGYLFSHKLTDWSGTGGAYLIVAVLFALGILLATELSFSSLAIQLSQRIKTVTILLGRAFLAAVSSLKRPRRKVRVERKKVSPKEAVAPQVVSKKEIPKVEPTPTVKSASFRFPPLSLLNSPPEIEGGREDVVRNSKLLEDALRDFDVETKVVQVNEGPVITSYELEPGTGVKVHSITALADDIALSLKTPSVRIIAPVPGKAVVGIEIPNRFPRFVYLREILSTKDFREAGSKLTIALGKDISGNPLISDLGEMPHLLIAGTTGSGKTVSINAIIISLLYRATPEEVKFLMIDPKRVELTLFEGLPHLISPVVTEAKKAANALRWIVEEMEGRYKLLAKAGARNIDRYNRMGEDKEPLPYIVVIIDELADLMAVAQVAVEDAIARLAQLSRAVGIHLILATQRPSVDVITGIIKANFPYRISFQVSSKVDSRTVLDMNGAERLIGKGDMLFLSAALPRPIRAQGSLVADQEIERVVNFLRPQVEPTYQEEIFKPAETEPLPEPEEDELFEKAVQIVVELGQASASHLQRRLRIGYNRAGRLIDRMEQEGIIGPPRGVKPRQILMKSRASVETEEDEST
ncbi:DNA translocase FtsK, partial [candidate division NPL-UPA2 bacterium]|nr:DNA translocase FtsK [candidate division NPL-UPA2 bacterium]